LAATRWLIEFVGIHQNKKGNPIACPGKRKDDVRVTDFGGRLLDPSTPDGRRLADLWKGCTQASSHATNADPPHPSVDDQTVLREALKVILDHLQDTIYDKESKKLRDYVLERVP
jgi:hypothetical protein